MPRPCEDYLEAISAAVDGELGVDEQAHLDAHLARCSGCRSWLNRLGSLRRRTLIGVAPQLEGLVNDLVRQAPEMVHRDRPHSETPVRLGVALRAVAAAAAAAILIGVGLVWTLGSRTASKPASTVVASPARRGSVVIVPIMDQQPTMRHVTIERGGTIRWVNTDLAHHHLVIDGGGARIDSDLPRRGSEAVTYSQPGTYRFDCALHPELSGTITVR